MSGKIRLQATWVTLVTLRWVGKRCWDEHDIKSHHNVATFSRHSTSFSHASRERDSSTSTLQLRSFIISPFRITQICPLIPKDSCLCRPFWVFKRDIAYRFVSMFAPSNFIRFTEELQLHALRVWRRNWMEEKNNSEGGQSYNKGYATIWFFWMNWQKKTRHERKKKEEKDNKRHDNWWQWMALW